MNKSRHLWLLIAGLVFLSSLFFAVLRPARAEETGTAPSIERVEAVSPAEAETTPSSSVGDEELPAREISPEDLAAAQPVVSQPASGDEGIPGVNGTPKELKGIIVSEGSELYDYGNSKTLVPDSEGAYTITRTSKYRYKLVFDLSKYNNNVNNGDWYNINIEGPVTLVDGQKIELKDPGTGIKIGTGLVTAYLKAKDQGGTVKVVLENLEAYLKAKGGTEVINARGNIWVDWSSTSVDEIGVMTADNTATESLQEWHLKFKDKKASVYTPDYNFAKRHGELRAETVTSDILGKTVDYVHNWTVDMNYMRKDYSSLTLHDEVAENSGPMQFIPESFVIKTGKPNNRLHLDNAETLSPDQYTVTFNSSYTAFDLTIKGAEGKAYKLTYKTTAPADGSVVRNVVSMKADGQVIPQTDKVPGRTTHVGKNLSKITEGGTLEVDTAYRIILYKTDADTGERLSGAEFEVHKADGSVVKLDPTDKDGRTISPRFSPEEINQSVKVVETKAPEGYEVVDAGEITITAEGSFKTIPNKRKAADPVKVSLSVDKTLTGRDLKADEFDFELVDEAGKVVATAKNDAAGKVTFPELSFSQDQVGQHVYSIREVAGKAAGITYDGKVLKATVTISLDKASHNLTSKVDYDQAASFTNRYQASAAKAKIQVSKELRGRDLKTDEFEFELLDAAGKLVASAKNDAAGQVAFEEISFDKAGTYEYSVREVAGKEEGVTYDDKTVKFLVTVVDKDGQLEADLAYKSEAKFVNSFTPPSTPPTSDVPNKPGENTPPPTSEVPNKPGKPGDSTPPPSGDQPAGKPSSKKVLPSTGQAASLLGLFGLGLALLAGLVLHRKTDK